MNNMIFLNHASFAIERDEEILLIDPWYEGTAFNNGWALLDKSTTNSSVINWLKTSNKKIYIWYSHEHSDHLSMSFLKLIKNEKIDLKIIFQKTLDGRVSAFLRSQGLTVLDAEEGQQILIGENLSIATWPYGGGDSFCLIKSEGVSLLNINDCVISTSKDAISVRDKIRQFSNSLNILLTQFGYANWAGNEDDKTERIKLANHKFDRIFIQEKILQPSTIIPFASFVYFCHPENFYLNDAQNSPESVINAEQLGQIQQKIFFMKPWDTISLVEADSISNQLSSLTKSAVDHWASLKNEISPIPTEIKKSEIQKMKDSFLKYRKKMSHNFLFLPQLFELLKIVRPIDILITDTNKVAHISYLNGITLHDNYREWHISLSSEVFNFIFENDFGFNTTHVNGRFRLGNNKKISDVVKFFIVQEFYKNGYGIKHPIVSAKFLTSEILRLFSKRLTKPTQPQP